MVEKCQSQGCLPGWEWGGGRDELAHEISGVMGEMFCLLMRVWVTQVYASSNSLNRIC